MICEHCKKNFSNKYNLIYHQKTTKSCLDIQNKKNPVTYDETYVNNLKREYETKINHLEKEIDRLEKELDNIKLEQSYKQKYDDMKVQYNEILDRFSNIVLSSIKN